MDFAKPGGAKFVSKPKRFLKYEIRNTKYKIGNLQLVCPFDLMGEIASAILKIRNLKYEKTSL